MSRADGEMRAAPFITGSTMRHVVVMTLTGAVGLMSLFMVDLVDLFFLSLLNDTEVTAAVGYAGTIVFSNLSVSIGCGIAAAALVARNVGAGDRQRARQFATSALMFALITASLITLAIDLGSGALLALLGAHGEARRLAQLFIWTLSPGYVLIAGAISCSFILRGLGDARRAMYITLSTAIVTACADPVFIFGFGWGIQGAAAATVLGYIVSFGIGLHGVVRVHRFINPFRLGGLKRDFPPLWAIAFPAILTQLAQPFANAYITYGIAPFGDESVAGFAIVGRLVPVAFGIIFSLAGSVGPIIGQNYGARRHDRVRRTLTDGLIFSAIYTLLTSLLLFLFRHQIAEAFNAAGRSRDLVVFFCTFIGISWAFTGGQFVANAAFNNLGRPTLSSWFNWAKATLGTIPFAMIGARMGGPEGLLAGTALGSVIFGIASVIAAYAIVRRSATKAAG
ncbi:MATE family efflux transporter [Aestuariivirga sp.]|uniref:MATE family efflux transporter n=1 Tax=Aestuariivirga sp. TaxID=2650926 RepID=UPI0025B8CBA7|nr:MATE family efflux transporter [Aestuariivirga sp.]MCA3554869.1 MATE family efflux transporter [Aestuariivirga sp.]